MKRARQTTWVVTAAALALGGAQTLAEQRLSGEQRDACGSILCLLAGMTNGDCAAYLNPFFAIRPPDLGAKRLDFLSQCPTGGSMPAGLVGLVASRATACQPTSLTSRLNAEILQCEAALEREQGFSAWLPDTSSCKPREDGWRGQCGSWYDSSYTTQQPPTLTATNCRGFNRDGDGVGCSWRWAAQ